MDFAMPSCMFQKKFPERTDMPKTKAFNDYCNEYDEWFEKNQAVFEMELEAVRQLLPPPGSGGVEIGVGTGNFAVPLGIKVGLEPSEAMARIARRRGVTVYAGVAEDLPFSDGEFEFVLMVTCICFFDDVARAFAEAFRILKAGGCIVVGFIDRESELGRRYDENRAASRFYREATFFSTPEVLNLLKEAGFECKGIRQTLIPGDTVATIREGYGAGAFVVVRGEKTRIPVAN
jgi:SAM-dependent methyltransferase